MAAGAQIMMHEPYFVFLFMMADKRVLLRLANRLEATIKSYAATYAAATVLTEAAARTMMEEETWLVAKDAARLGLAKVHDPGRARPAPVPEPDRAQIASETSPRGSRLQPGIVKTTRRHVAS